jgi:hypothetical protein
MGERWRRDCVLTHREGPWDESGVEALMGLQYSMARQHKLETEIVLAGAVATRGRVFPELPKVSQSPQSRHGSPGGWGRVGECE